MFNRRPLTSSAEEKTTTQEIELFLNSVNFELRLIKSENYSSMRHTMLETMSFWTQYFETQTKNTKINNMQLHDDWLAISRNIKEHLEQQKSQKSHDWFLVSIDSELQGIAHCGPRKVAPWGVTNPSEIPRSYHIFNMLTAPWNLLPRCMRNANDKLPYLGVGTALLSAIVDHAKHEDKAESITVVAGYTMSNVSAFYRKRMFDGTKESTGRFRLYAKDYDDFLDKYKPQKKSVAYRKKF